MDDMQPGARTRNISALFVENQDGERFKYPFIHLAGARAMQRHVANGGLPYDDIGKSIISMSEEIAQLKSFSNYVVRNDLMNSDTNNIVERGQVRLESLREQIKALSKQSHYESYVENFQLQEQNDIPDEVVEDFVEKFTVKNFKEDIKSVFPVLYRLMQEESTLGYDDIVAMTQEEIVEEDQEEAYDPFDKFENWAMGLGEESAISSQDEEEQQSAIKELQALVGEHFPAGVDGTNAIESLKGIIEDPALYKEIKDQAKEDADSCVRPLVKDWLEANAPEVVDQLDFGDMTEPAEEPQMADVQYEGDIDPNRHPQTKDYGPGDEDDLPFEPDENPTDKDEFGNTIKHKARHLARKGMRQAMDVKELAEFITSFYDKESGTFPKGPEGVCTMVGKKFGEQAEQVARKFVERMAPHQEQGAEELAELGRMRELAGLQSEEQQTTEGSPRTADVVADALSKKGVKYSPEKEKEIIGMIGDELEAMGMDSKQIRYYMSYDEDFIPDTLDGLDREEKPEESVAPELEDIRRLSGIAQGISY
jgi:cell pole-organizing protein PopZ